MTERLSIHTREERNLQSLSECGSQIERSGAVI